MNFSKICFDAIGVVADFLDVKDAYHLSLTCKAFGGLSKIISPKRFKFEEIGKYKSNKKSMLVGDDMGDMIYFRDNCGICVLQKYNSSTIDPIYSIISVEEYIVLTHGTSSAYWNGDIFQME